MFRPQQFHNNSIMLKGSKYSAHSSVQCNCLKRENRQFFNKRSNKLKSNILLKSGVDQQRHLRLFCRTFIFIIWAYLFILHGLLFRQWRMVGVSMIRDPSLQKTTIVLMGYSTKRLENYLQIFPAYGAMEQALDRIIFLWNSKSFFILILSNSQFRSNHLFHYHTV